MLLTEMFDEGMNFEKALKYFGLTQSEFSNMTLNTLRDRWKTLMKKHHPDNPDNKDRSVSIGDINAANDFLKNKFAASAFRRGAVADPKVPEWQPDKHAFNNTINAESYRDANFIKRHLWELSNKSTTVYTIYAYGPYGFEGRLKVYGTPGIFGEMAQAMLVYNANGGKGKTRAIFVTTPEQPKVMYLIYSDGRSFGEKPIPIEYHTDPGTQFKDEKFLDKVNQILDRIKELFARATAAQGR